MPSPISATECITPAFNRTKKALFQPFQIGLWARLAVVALMTGEVGTGGGTSGANFNPNRGGRHLHLLARLFSTSGWEEARPYLHWIVLASVGVLALVLLWTYCASVYRFILLDVVLTGQCRLKEGWRRWKSCGAEYFVWVIGFGICSLLVLGTVIGLPIWAAYRAGWFDKPDQHLPGLISGGALLVLLFFALLILFAAIDLFARDFLIPVMAFENVNALDGWERLLSLMTTDKAAYVVYVLMKVVLAVGSAIFFAIVDLFAVLFLLIPILIVGLFGLMIGKMADWNISVVLLLVALGLLALAAILFVMGFVYAPGLVFFQSYALEFFGSRYEPLRVRLFAGPPPPVPPSAPPSSGPPRMPIPPWPSEPFPT